MKFCSKFKTSYSKEMHLEMSSVKGRPFLFMPDCMCNKIIDFQQMTIKSLIGSLVSCIVAVAHAVRYTISLLINVIAVFKSMG